MSRLTLVTLIICSLCILGGSFGNSAYAGSSCQSHVRLFAPDDYGDNPLAESTYDPCDGALVWRFTFSRTLWDRPDHECSIEYRILEGSATIVFFREVHSWLCPPGTQNIVLSGTQTDVPHSDSHIFQILRSTGNDGGLFYNIEGIADYRPGTPQ